MLSRHLYHDPLVSDWGRELRRMRRAVDQVFGDFLQKVSAAPSMVEVFLRFTPPPLTNVRTGPREPATGAAAAAAADP